MENVKYAVGVALMPVRQKIFWKIFAIIYAMALLILIAGYAAFAFLTTAAGDTFPLPGVDWLINYFGG